MTIELNIANIKVDLPEIILKQLAINDRLKPKKKKKKKGEWRTSNEEKINQVFPDIEPKHSRPRINFKPSLSITSVKNFDLQIICFKLQKDQMQLMDKLKQVNLYFSRSEIIRVACREWLKKSSDLQINTNFGNESISAKLPQQLLYCIDQLPIKSRSDFIRKAINNFILERENFHTYFSNYENNSKKLKVIAFKLPEEQLSAIKLLCNNGFYPSISEVVRIAIINYLLKIINFNNEMNNNYWLSLQNQKKINTWNINQDKISACSKMPLQLLDILDDVISYNDQFGNRTNFIRLAVDEFLAEDNQIYAPYLVD